MACISYSLIYHVIKIHPKPEEVLRVVCGDPKYTLGYFCHPALVPAADKLHFLQGDLRTGLDCDTVHCFYLVV